MFCDLWLYTNVSEEYATSVFTVEVRRIFETKELFVWV
jgi:hypothetical protein